MIGVGFIALSRSRNACLGYCFDDDDDDDDDDGRTPILPTTADDVWSNDVTVSSLVSIFPPT